MAPIGQLLEEHSLSPAVQVLLSIAGTVISAGVVVVIAMLRGAKEDRLRLESKADVIGTDVGDMKTSVAANTEWIRGHIREHSTLEGRVNGLESRERSGWERRHDPRRRP